MYCKEGRSDRRFKKCKQPAKSQKMFANLLCLYIRRPYMYVGMYVILKKRKIENLAEGKMKEEYKVKNLS